METTKTTYQEDEFEIDLLGVLRALKKRIWLILLAAVLGGGIFGAFSKFVLVPQYLSLIHISEPTRQAEISYAVFCLKKKKQNMTYKHRECH